MLPALEIDPGGVILSEDKVFQDQKASPWLAKRKLKVKDERPNRHRERRECLRTAPKTQRLATSPRGRRITQRVSKK